MVTTHSLGYPRMGLQRELKFALEADWRGAAPRAALLEMARTLRARHWQDQAALKQIPVGDFSLYDHVLDMSFTLGHLPARARGYSGDGLDNYFRVARGRAGAAGPACCAVGADASAGDIAAGEMTKWFDTNYHYIVPEFSADTTFCLDDSRLRAQWQEAQALGVPGRVVLIGPVTYLLLGKSRDGVDRFSLLPALLREYSALLARLHEWGVTWVQMDESALVTDLDATAQHAFNLAYHELKSAPVKILIATSFGGLGENRYLAAHLPVAGLHVDAVRGRDEVALLLNLLPDHRVLSLGVVDGRNVWRTDLDAVLDWLEPIAARLGERLWIAPSCSLLHVPVDLALETGLDEVSCSWLAFARQKVDEVALLGRALNEERAAVAEALAAHRVGVESRRRASTAGRLHSTAVQAALAAWQDTDAQRSRPHAERAVLQQARLHLPAYPTTTIGSFPQTAAIRTARRRLRAGELDAAAYDQAMRDEIVQCIRQQEALDLDVLVHGEAERNDMVEYFGERLGGCLVTRNGWVQSYGSRCVKPPVIAGDVFRSEPMTVAWTTFAQSCTPRPVKGMLTGPVTILNWSFVRDDQPRAQTCRQIALAIRAEVLDLEAAGTSVIQIDEPALREGLPLRVADRAAYLDWAVRCFRVAAGGVRDDTQIHTHMCYAEFNDIIEPIVQLDADVITIETARSAMELLDAFERFEYPNGIGPGVYDIHSPNCPEVARMVALMQRAAERIPAARLWVNPDCGLKTRQWDEVVPALRNMVQAARTLRAAAVRMP